MKFLLENQIPGFQTKSKGEKNALCRIANIAGKPTPRATFYFILCITISIIAIRTILEDGFGVTSHWPGMICVAVIGGLFGVFQKCVIINPIISEIIKQESIHSD